MDDGNKATQFEHGNEHDASDYAPSSIQQEVSKLHSSELQQAERHFLRKLDFILLPVLSTLYFFEYLDRANIANAKLLGLSAGYVKGGVGPGERSLSPTQWQTVIMVFYVGLILFQVPGCIGYRVFPPTKWIAFGVCGWCATSMLQNSATNLSGLLACRVFLGVFEGCFGTGIVYYLSLWYTRHELGMRVFWFLGPTSLAGAFGGLIAYGIGHIQSPVAQWKWLYLVEALPGFLLGLFCMYWLPDRPLRNSRFTRLQQQIAVARYHAEDYDRAERIQKKHIVMAFTNWQVYAQASIYFPLAVLLASISAFLPSIVSDLGYTKTTTANLMTVPPYVCGFLLTFVVSWISDRYKRRGVPITILMSIATIMYALLAALPRSQLHGKYVCICIAVACVYATYPPSHAWAANNLGNETTRAIGMGLYTALGNCGAIAGSWVYPSNEAPQYRQGHLICMALALATALLSLANALFLRFINHRRDMRHGKPIAGATIDVTELAYKSPHFRFVT